MLERHSLVAVTDTHSSGFRSLRTEVSNETLPVEGTVPAWLSGTLVRNGPGRFESGDERVNHWFDGLAMLRRYSFEDSTVNYTNRFLRTDAYADAQAGTLSGQFGTDGSGWQRALSWLRSLGPPTPTDNANVHVARFDGEYVALTEAPRRVAFDPETLETRGEFSFGDDIAEHVTAAHLVDDPHRGEWVGFTTQFGLSPQYHVYRVPAGSQQRERITSIDARGPSYIHDCSVTDSHVVLVESPLVLSVWRALAPWNEGVTDLLDWRPAQGTRILVVDRDTGDIVADPVVDAAFIFHHVNAYTDDESVVLDLVEFPDASIVGAMSLSDLDGEFPAVPDATLARYRISLDGSVERSRLYDGGIELPRVTRSVVGRSHRYAYGQATDREGANGLVKVDCQNETAREWWERGVYVEEPIPVQHPDAEDEDDGVVLATALDTERDQTMLLIFDAATLELLARATLPHAEPFGFHGRYWSEL